MDVSVVASDATASKPRRNGKAKASLAFGLLCLLSPIIAIAIAVGILPSEFFLLIAASSGLAIFMGRMARREIHKSSRPQKGRDLALFGMILGCLGGATLALAAGLTIYDWVYPPMTSAARTAVGSLRTINTVATTYASKYGGGSGYPISLSVLGPPLDAQDVNAMAAGMIDPDLAGGRKYGFRFTYVPGAVDEKGFARTYLVHADPVDESKFGHWHFFTDQTGVIRGELKKPANASSPPLN